MNISHDTTEYRNTGIFLNSNRSTRGTNKVEQLHSVQDRVFYISNNIRELLYDARGHWTITNYNRRRLTSLGKPHLDPGVAPIENDSCPLLVESTELKFGFQYYNSVMESLDKSINDEVLAAIESDTPNTVDTLDGPENEYVDADDNTDVATILASSLADFASAPIDMDIPDSVDLETLGQIAEAIEATAVTHTAAMPTVPPLDSLALESSAALQECNVMSNLMGQEAGIDTDALFGSIDLFEQNDSNERRNVSLRQAQGQQAAQVGPAFNDEMKEKWLELWSSGTNPSDGRISFRDWFTKKQKEYKLWMYKRLLEAEEKDITPRPQLVNVSYQATKKWVDEMKSVANSTLRTGTINAESALLVEQFDSFMSASTHADNVAPFADEGGIGVAIDRSTLQLNVTTTAARENSFQPPTSDTVEAVMPARKKKPSKSKQKEIDPQLLLRQEKAKTKMDAHTPPIQPDPKAGGKRR